MNIIIYTIKQWGEKHYVSIMWMEVCGLEKYFQWQYSVWLQKVLLLNLNGNEGNSSFDTFKWLQQKVMRWHLLKDICEIWTKFF